MDCVEIEYSGDPFPTSSASYDGDNDDVGDICSQILSRYSTSTQEEHQHLCTVIGQMSQTLKEQNFPSTPLAYFGAVTASLNGLLSAPEPPPPHIVDSMTSILALVLPIISPTILRKQADLLRQILVNVVRLNSTSVGAIVSGLQCVSHLLVIGNKASWLDMSQLYGALLGFITDSRLKVRSQSHSCLRDVLVIFQGMPVLAPACDAILKTFERFLLLAREDAKGAQEVLYVIDALIGCLPLMSTKYMSSILKYYKTLLEVGQSLVIRRITNSLNVLCFQPTVEIPAEPLGDILSLLATNVSTNETTADGMTCTARLLSAGMTRIYSQNRQICVIKIPLVFTALKDILASEHEEAIFAATEAFKSLINTCVDENLIQQGVNEIRNANGGIRKSGPTIIEKACATIESLLDYSHSAVWDVAFQVVSTMFDKLGNFTPNFMRGTLKNLEDMQNLLDEDFPYRKQLHECVGSALGAMGPEMFLRILPLNLDADDLVNVNVWLFPILKKYTVGTNLSYFTETVLDWIADEKQKSRKLEFEGRVVSSRSRDALVYSLWSLLPAFSNYALDTAKSFPNLVTALCTNLREEQVIRGIICSCLQILIQQNKKMLEGKSELSDPDVSIAKQRAQAHYNPEVAMNNMNALKAPASIFLSILFDIFVESSKDDGGLLQSTIGEFASIADKKVVSKLFMTRMQQLLKATLAAANSENTTNSNSMQTDNPSSERARLMDLSISLLPGLGAKEIDVLYSAVKPSLVDVEGQVQKKAYKVLSIILKNSDSFLSSKLEELLNLMIEVMPSCHFSAKRHRLDCLYFLIVRAFKDESGQRNVVISSFLTEIILAFKEANKKTRNRAFQLLVEIGHAYGDEANGGNKENLYQLFNMVAAGLVVESPHMISAAVKGLARLAHEFSDLVSTATQLLPSTFLLLQRKNREIIKASLGLLKVVVAKSQAEWLQMHLNGMVEGLLRWQDDSKTHFKAKVKFLLEMLVKKCGMDAVKAVMPEEHMKLLTNIRKIKARKEKKLPSNSEECKSLLSRATTSRQSRWNYTKIFSDFGDGETEGSGSEYQDAKTAFERSRLQSKASTIQSKRSRRPDRSLTEDLYDQLDDEPLDLLDRNKTRLALRSSGNRRRKQDSDDEPEIDSEGRLIIHEGEKRKKEKHLNPDSDLRSEAGSFKSSKSTIKTQKRRKTGESGWAYTGNEYSNKKAGGDLKKKGKLEPYAYWPLDRKMMSRRAEHKAAARKGMASVVNLKKLEGKSARNALSVKLPKSKKGQRLGSKRKSK